MQGSKHTPVLCLVVAMSAVDCGGPPRPRITELETISTTASSLAIARLDIVFDGGRIQRIYEATDGTTIRWARVRYDDQGRIRAVEQMWGDDEELAVTTFGYDKDNRIALIRKTKVNGDSVGREIDYDDGKLTKVIHRIGTFNPITEETDLTSWTETWRYDGNDRPERILTEGLGEPVITDLSWEQDLLDGTKTTTAGLETSNAFSYEEGRLIGVSGQGGGRSELTYDGDRVVSISVSGGSATTTVRYFYDDGTADGVLARPQVPDGFFFDLAGHILDDLGSLPLSLLLD